jgi:branched-chain amino acid transport system substrate-binding protein
VGGGEPIMTRLALAGLVVCLALQVASCGGHDAAPIKIGVLADCEGIYGIARAASDAGAELPLIQRGARPLGSDPSSGISETEVAGKKIQVLLGCGDGTTEKAVSEARLMVEQRGADVLIGPTLNGESVALKEYARRRPETTFIETIAGAQSLTLDDPARNVYRFSYDGAQVSAGLGAYAYRTLGWRRAVTVGEDEGVFGGGGEYAQVAGFVAEFCALGGEVVRRFWSAPGEVSAYAAGNRADGFFVLDPSNFETEFGTIRGSLAKRILGGLFMGSALVSPELERRLVGVVTGGTEPVQSARPWRDYLAAMGKAFPGLEPETPLLAAQTVFPHPYYDAMAAVIKALQQVHGDLSGGERRFQAALANVRLDSPIGPIRLDQNRQAILPNYLGQYQRGSSGEVSHRTIQVVPNVDQSFGGYFHTNGPQPSRTYPPCRRGDPPAWARSG